ncbi:MAG: hypothetical protein LC105_00345 [Chitinophagales bacterium]|nr:hypothetical protein [Chitinophagales bacterium]MCZ2392294.1 hypothetical protein [Chitinophagales bacterium]
MKRLSALFMAFLMIFQMGYANGILKSSTSIPIRNVEAISSETKNATYQFQVIKDIKDSKGNVVITEGTPVLVDLKLKNRKSVGKAGVVDVKLKSVQAVDGQTIDLRGGVAVEPENIQGKVLGVGLGVGLFLFPLMLLYLIKKGDKAVLSENTTIIGNPIMDYEL